MLFKKTSYENYYFIKNLEEPPLSYNCVVIGVLNIGLDLFLQNFEKTKRNLTMTNSVVATKLRPSLATCEI